MHVYVNNRVHLWVTSRLDQEWSVQHPTQLWALELWLLWVHTRVLTSGVPIRLFIIRVHFLEHRTILCLFKIVLALIQWKLRIVGSRKIILRTEIWFTECSHLFTMVHVQDRIIFYRKTLKVELRVNFIGSIRFDEIIEWCYICIKRSIVIICNNVNTEFRYLWRRPCQNTSIYRKYNYFVLYFRKFNSKVVHFIVRVVITHVVRVNCVKINESHL